MEQPPGKENKDMSGSDPVLRMRFSEMQPYQRGTLGMLGHLQGSVARGTDHFHAFSH